jgi:hypothetical protein
MKMLTAQVSDKFHEEVKLFCREYDLTIKQLLLRSLRAEMDKVRREALWRRKQ